MAAGQMEITLELKYKFEGDPFELREHAVKFDLTNRALGGPSSGNVEYIISKSDSEIETHLQHPPEEGVQFQLRHRTFEGLKHAESLLSSLVQRVKSDFDKMKKAVGVSEKAWIVIYEPVTVHCGCCGRKRKGTIANLEQHFRSHLEKEFNMLAVRVSRLPPETTKKDVTDTFGAFGEITNIRRIQVPSDVKDRCAGIEYKSPNAVDSIINKDQAESISIRGSKLLISRVKKGEEMLPPPAPPPPTPPPTQELQRNQGSQRSVPGTYRQNTAPVPLNPGMPSINFEQLKDKPEIVAQLIGLFTAQQNQSNVGADGAAFADQVYMVLQQAFQAPQEGASAAAGGPGDFTRKRAGVEMPGGTPKRQRQEFAPFASEQENYTEQGEFSGYASTGREQGEMGTPSSAKGSKSSQSRLDALRQSIGKEEKDSTQKRVQFKGSKKHEPPAEGNRDDDIDDADDFVDDGGGSPMDQDNVPEFSGDRDETAKVETPKPVNYEPRQVHVSGFSLVTNQEDLVSALTSEYGKISDCKMHRKAFKTQVTRFAVVEFEEESTVKKILGSKYEIVSNVGRYRLTIARIAMESQDNEQSSGSVVKSANTESEATSAEKKEYSPEIVEEQKFTVKVVTSLIELVDRTTFPEKTESVDDNMMKKLNKDQHTVAKDLQKANRHRTITRMAYILNALKGIDDEPRVAHTLYLWDRKILSKQFFHEPKDAGLLHIVQELEPAVQQALKKSAKFNAISLYRKIASIVNFVVDRKEADEEKAFAARGVKFRSKSGKQGQGGGSFLRDEVDHPEDVPKYLDLHKGPDEVHEFDTVLGDDADVEFTGDREPQGLVGAVSIRSKKIGERKLTLNSPPDMAVKSARKIILQKMDEDNKMLSRPLSMLVKHTIQMCIHKIIAVLYYRHRKVINKFQQEDLTSQLIRQELKIARKTPIEEPSRPIELSGVRYEKKKEPPSAKVSSMQEEPTSIEPDEPMEQDEQKISPYAPPTEMATVSGPKDFQTYDEYPEEIQQLVVKWKKSVRYNEMHTKEQYTAIKKLKMELSQANRLIINKKMGTINQENYTREETVDLRLCMIFEVKHKLEEKKKEKYQQKMKKAKMEKEKKKAKKDKEKDKEREKEKPKPKKHVLALSSTSSDSDSDLDLPKKTPPKTLQQTPHKEKHKVDLVPEGKTDADVKRKLIAEKREKEQSVVKSETTEKETVKKETEGEKGAIEKSEPQSTSQKSKMESSDKNPDLREVDKEEGATEDQNKKVAVKSETAMPEKATESKPTNTETMKSKEIKVEVTSKTKKEIDDSGDNIFQKLSKDLTLQLKDSGEDGSKTDSSKDRDAEVKQSGDEMNQSDSCAVISETDKPEAIPKVSQNDKGTAAKDTPPEKEKAPVVPESRSRSVSRSSSSSGSSGRSQSKSRSRSRSVSRASSRSSRASSRSGSRASSNSGSRASSRSGSRASSRSGSRSSSRASSRSGSNASSRSGSGGSAKSRSRSRSNSGSRSGSGSRAASPSRSRSRSKSSSAPRSRSVSNASSRSSSRSVSRSRSRSKSSSRSRSRSRSNSRSSSVASVKSASGSESSDEDCNQGDLSASENKEAKQESTTKTEGKENSVKNLEGKDITNAGNEAKKDTSEGNKDVQDDREVERKASPVQNLGIGSPERVEDDKIVASDSSGPGSPKYPSLSSEAEVKDPGGDERSIDTEMQEVIEQVINLQEQMGVTEKEPGTTVQDSNDGKQKATESETAPKETTEVEMQEATPEPTLEDDIRDAEISMEAPPEPDESTAPATVDDDDDDDSSDDEDDSYETDSSSLLTGSPAASLQDTGFIELTKEEASKAFYEELTSEQRRCVYKELERNVRIQKKVGIPYTHEEKSAIKTQLIGKYLKIQREDPNSKGEILTNLEKKELKRLKKEERKRHKKKRRKEKHERTSGSDGRSPMPMRSPRELPAQYMDLPAQYADPTPDEILEANLSDGDSWRQRNKERSDHRESDSHRSRDRDDRREHHRTPRARRGGGWNSRGHSSSSRGSGSSHRWEREDRRRSPDEGRRYRDDHRDKGNYHDSRRQQRW